MRGGWRKEVVQRKKNESEKEPLEYVFINDLILASPGTFENCTPLITKKKPRKTSTPGGLNHFYYESQEDSHIFFAPSSPHYKDIMKIIPLISQEDYLHFFRHRFEDIIVTAINEGFEVIIFDLPPGFHGLSKAICDMMFDQIKAKIEKEEKKIAEPTRLDSLFHALQPDSENFIESRVIFVTTSDRPDYNAIVPLFCNYMREKYQKKFFFWENESNSEKKNRYPYGKLKGSVDFIFNKVKTGKGEVLNGAFVTKHILGNLNSNDEYNLEDVKKLIKMRIEDLGAVPCANITSFDMETILSTIKALYSLFMDRKKKEKKLPDDFLADIGKWCKNIAKTLDIADLKEIEWAASF